MLTGPPTVPTADEGERLDYQPLAGVHDHLRDAQGATREPWAQLERSFAALGRDALARAAEHADRLIHTNGVTYNVYADPRGVHRPWSLDPVPFVLGADEWKGIEAGLEQRARLLDALLRDLYGPQRVVREGLIPPELVFANPGFLRPCHGALAPDRPMLYLHGAELVRDATGAARVLGDRTQAPSGAGYALENRLVLGQALPQLFRHHPVQRMAKFWHEYRESLRASPAIPKENPFIVLLTPGPYNETYFEHSYLASYLGLTLVTGGDLAVRDERVYLKTLGGLERVDVILRRVDDGYCDPLSLRGDSALGVAGLTHAVRAGNVAVANALGTGVIETRALLPFLPALARALLGEELLVPSADTYYCGRPDDLAYVRDNLESLVVTPTFPVGDRRRRYVGASLTAAARGELLARIEASPTQFVAQSDLVFATSPSWSLGAIAPRPVALLTFAARAGSKYEVLPGGLARVAPEARSRDISMQRGSSSKDAWVLADGPVSTITLLHRSGQPLAVSRAGGDLPSRAADDLFWLGRYAERAEFTARLMRTLTANLGESSTYGGPGALAPLSHALAVHTELEAELGSGASPFVIDALEREIVSFLCAEAPPRGLRNVLGQAQRVALAVRDRISHDAVRAMQLAVEAFDGLPQAKDLGLGGALDVLHRVLMALAAFSGMGFEGLTRGQGYRFAEMGRRVERAHATARLLWSTLVSSSEDESPILLALLHTLDSSGAHRRRYRGVLEVPPVVDLLVFDERNPRSVAYQLRELEGHAAELPGERSRPYRRAEDRLVLGALSRIRLTGAEEACAVGPDARRPKLEALLLATAEDMTAFSETLTQSYFAHAVARLSVSGIGEEST